LSELETGCIIINAENPIWGRRGHGISILGGTRRVSVGIHPFLSDARLTQGLHVLWILCLVEETVFPYAKICEPISRNARIALLRFWVPRQTCLLFGQMSILYRFRAVATTRQAATSEPFNLGIHAAVLCLPGIEPRATPMLAAQLRRLHPSFMLFQYP
jgi:hypothetical protein